MLTLGVWVVIARVTHRAAAAQVAQAAGATGFNLRDFGSYLWQFYLPKLPVPAAVLDRRATTCPPTTSG